MQSSARLRRLNMGAAAAAAAPLIAAALFGFARPGVAEIVYIRRDDQPFRLWSAERACTELAESLASAQHEADLSSPQPCPTQWDTIGCWPATAAGSSQAIRCPSYVNLFETEAVTRMRTCLSNGSWEEAPPGWNSTVLLTERYRPCFHDNRSADGALEVPTAILDHLPNVIIIYDVGYSTSLLALFVAIALMLSMRKLRCPRNTIHIHLFFSFIVRAVMTLLSSHLLASQSVLNTEMVYYDGSPYFTPNVSHWECKLLTTVTHYASGANFMWIFIEALYLHMLIFATSFTDTSGIRKFVVAGWLGPLLYIIPYVVVRIYVDDHECWSNYSDRNLRWIVEGPMVLTIVVNFILFLNIIRVLATKLRAPHAREGKNIHRKLAKSTLVLIPLFGVHWIFFLALDVHMEDVAAEIARFYFDTLLTSFQGFAVSLLFCFCNGEVQAELKKKWLKSSFVTRKLTWTQGLGIKSRTKMTRTSVPTETTLIRDSRRNTPVGADGSSPEEHRSPAEEKQHLVGFVEDETPRNYAYR